MSWFIQSWAAFDGYAFASHSNYHFAADGDAAADRRTYLDPDRVVFLGPPHFTPVPVRYATALAASRGPFQDGFADSNGVEVAFETIDQVIELVRRAYVAGGANLQPPPGGDQLSEETEPPEPTPEQTVAEARAWNGWLARAAAIRTRRDRQDWLGNFHLMSSAPLIGSLGAFCRNSLTALAGRLPFQRDAATPAEMDLVVWWSLVTEMLGFVRGTPHWMPPWPYYGYPMPAAFGADLEASVLSGLLHRIPCPDPGPHGFASLGQHLCAATSDKQYLASLSSLELALPMLTAAFAIAAARSWAARLPSPGSDGSVVRARGLYWLANQFPDGTLDAIPAAGAAITTVLARSQQPGYRRVP